MSRLVVLSCVRSQYPDSPLQVFEVGELKPVLGKIGVFCSQDGEVSYEGLNLW
jgi:hypothetical protein